MDIVDNARSLAPFHGCSLVPTMGALHQGHVSLIERAVLSGKPALVSIFVNPTQFSPGEDFSKYPRTLEIDAEMCRKAGAKAIFKPSVEEMYPEGVAAANKEAAALPLPAVATKPGLEDANRPTHFAGVCQVVAKLFDLCRPSSAFFGEKDFQQLRVVQEMVRMANPRWNGLEIHACPTVREPDGLAMSSRNRYLQGNHRSKALGLSLALAHARKAMQSGANAAAAELEMRRVLGEHELDVDYAVVRSADSLLPLDRRSIPARALIAARIQGVRLIDNAVIDRDG